MGEMDCQLELYHMEDFQNQIVPGLQLTQRRERVGNILSLPSELGTGGAKVIQLREGFQMTVMDMKLNRPIRLELKAAYAIFELNFCFGGKTATTINKNIQLNTDPGKSTMIFSTDNHVVFELPAGENLRFLELNITPDVLYDYLYSCGEGTDIAFSKLFQPQHFHYFPTSITPDIQYSLNQMLTCPYDGWTKKLYLEGKALELLARLFQEHFFQQSRPQDSLSKEDWMKLGQARDYILKHLNAPLSLLQVSRQVGLNDFKLKRGFRERYQMTVFEFIRNHRLEWARCLLEEEGMTVQQAMRQVGYSNGSHFAAAFKDKFGVNPSEWLNRRK
jgi:AraC family transcriptional activator of pyochelin receptor